MTAVARTSLVSATSRIAVVFALLAAAFWGFGIVAAKAALDRGAPPLTLAAVQLVASVAALAPLSLIASSARQFGRRGLAARVSLSGALEYGVTATLFTVGMGMTSAGNASLINAAEPVLIIAGAVVLLKERVGARAILLAVLALIVVSGLLQHAGAVWLHLHALRRMPASAFALFLGLVPVFALIGARAFLGETVTGPQLAGGALVIAAAMFAGRKPPASSPDKEITP